MVNTLFNGGPGENGKNVSFYLKTKETFQPTIKKTPVKRSQGSNLTSALT